MSDEQEQGASLRDRATSEQSQQAVSALRGGIPSAAISGAESTVHRWLVIDRKADTDTGDEGEDCYNIGVRDGYQEAVQIIDMLTGGDGEYRFCTNRDPERHCPDPVFMIRNILARFYAQGIEAGTDETPQAAQPEGQEPDPEGDAPVTPGGQHE